MGGIGTYSLPEILSLTKSTNAPLLGQISGDMSLRSQYQAINLRASIFDESEAMISFLSDKQLMSIGVLWPSGDDSGLLGIKNALRLRSKEVYADASYSSVADIETALSILSSSDSVCLFGPTQFIAPFIGKMEQLNPEMIFIACKIFIKLSFVRRVFNSLGHFNWSESFTDQSLCHTSRSRLQ